MKITDAVKARLQEIEAKAGGRLTADAVVADAKRKNSPLHNLFEWDLKKAAEAHWIETAREIIVAVKVTVTNHSLSIQAPYYVRDPTAKSSEQGYVAVVSLRGQHDAAREVICAEFSRAVDLLRRARHVAAAIGMDSEVDAIVDSIVELRTRVMHSEPAQTM